MNKPRTPESCAVIMKKIFICLLGLLPSITLAEDIVAVLDLKFEKETEDVAAWMCYDEKEEDCHPWAYFYVFNATVKKVVHGKLPKKKIKVTYGRHALKKGSFKNVIVILSKLTESTKAEYQILEWGTEKNMYCFSDDTPYNIRLESSKIDLKCYEKE